MQIQNIRTRVSFSHHRRHLRLLLLLLLFGLFFGLQLEPGVPQGLGKVILDWKGGGKDISILINFKITYFQELHLWRRHQLQWQSGKKWQSKRVFLIRKIIGLSGNCFHWHLSRFCVTVANSGCTGFIFNSDTAQSDSLVTVTVLTVPEASTH